jgi:glycosyltransferase involved in cell wall biosynthesis
VARIADVREATSSWRRADGPGVTFHRIPSYRGPFDYMRQSVRVHKASRAAVSRGDAVILRSPSNVSATVERALHGKPFGVEVVGDPHDVFAPNSTAHPLRPVWRRLFTRQVKRQCRNASAVCYVTAGALQRRYPGKPGALRTSFVNMEMDPQAFAPSPRRFSDSVLPRRIITVGSLEQPYKGVDVLIDATARCVADGLDLELVVAGDGKLRPALEQRAQLRGIAGRVAFLGSVASGRTVREQLDRADLFVLASKTEGLPRALIEAMARGLPCLGSDVGGIPELLPPSDLVPRGDVVALANSLRDVLTNSARMTRMSETNWKRAQNYSDAVLDAKRDEFCIYLKEVTSDWLRSKTRMPLPSPAPKGSANF